MKETIRLTVLFTLIATALHAQKNSVLPNRSALPNKSALRNYHVKPLKLGKLEPLKEDPFKGSTFSNVDSAGNVKWWKTITPKVQDSPSCGQPFCELQGVTK